MGVLSSTVSADLYVRVFVFLIGNAEPFDFAGGFWFAGRLDLAGGMAGGRGRKVRTGGPAGSAAGDLGRGGMLENTVVTVSRDPGKDDKACILATFCLAGETRPLRQYV